MATTTLTPVRARGTTIALKLLMAVTGLFFVFYVLLHMYGNLKVLAGPEAFDGYAHHLRTFGEPMLPYEGLLWIIRVLLVLSLIGHAYSAFTLWSRAGSARRTKYAALKTASSSKTMRWGGVFLLLFLTWHLIHFTIVKPAVNSGVASDTIHSSPYAMVVASFQLWWMVIFYVLALAALGLHLSHGVFSAQQTLGWTQTAAGYRRAKAIGHLVAGLVTIGFAIPPLSILFGLVK
ncbi:MAG TPA: succinate dehydrogenase cytochrome b subunit [Phycicoccus sp.]|nr:succinate dehydrogenase cytochrome b subunit [Phycicoccus sp.]